MKKYYITERFPNEFANKHMHEVDLVAWLNEKLREGKMYCGYVPAPNGMILEAIFLVEET